MKQTMLYSLALGYIFAHPFAVRANNSEVERILNEVNQLEREGELLIQEADVEGQKYQNYLNSLYQQCVAGDRSACLEYENRMREQKRRSDYLEEHRDQFYRDRAD